MTTGIVVVVLVANAAWCLVAAGSAMRDTANGDPSISTGGLFAVAALGMANLGALARLAVWP